MKKITLIFSSAILSTGAAVAQAAGGDGWYVGAGLGSSRATDGTSFSSSLDANLAAQGIASSTGLDHTDTAWKLFGGYQFNQYYGLEGGYDRLGRFSANSAIAGGGGGGTWDANDVWSLAATGTLPITDQFSALAKLGLAYSNIDFNYAAAGPGGTVSINQSTNRTQPLFGLGLKYNFDQHVAVRGEVEHFKDLGDGNTGQSDINVWSANIQYLF
jgi:OOP family OmpA-OmpF porin